MAVKTTYGIQIDSTVLRKHLQDFALVMGRELGDVVKNQAALWCRDMIDYTPPFTSPGNGSDKGSFKIGAEKVAGQIKSIFKPIISRTDSASPSEIAAIGREDVFKMWTNGIRTGKADDYLTRNHRKTKWSKFQQNYGSSNLGGTPRFTDRAGMKAFHDSMRSNNGRGAVKKSSINSGNFIFVKDDSDIKWYIKQKQKNVGIMKSGYYFASEALKESVGFPAWVKHSEGTNEKIAVNEISKPMLPTVTVGNKIGNITQKVSASRVNFVTRLRAEKMRTQMKNELNRKKISLWDATMSGKISGTASFFH
jgi:hypothetical protein